MKKVTTVLGSLIFLAIGVCLSTTSLTSPNMKYKNLHAATVTSFVSEPLPAFRPGVNLNETDSHLNVVHDTVYVDSIVCVEKLVPHVIVKTPKSKPVDTTTSVMSHEVPADIEPAEVKIPLILTVNDSVVFTDSVHIRAQ